MEAPRPVQRVDKWLFCARFFKTRALAASVVSKGHLRINGQKVAKPAHVVGPGDVLTFPQARVIRVIRVEAPAERRGPASEARGLYTDLEPGEAGSEPGDGAERPPEEARAAGTPSLSGIRPLE